MFGIFPAATVNDDDIEIYTDESRGEVFDTVIGLRQQTVYPTDRPNLSLSDFVAHDDYNSIMAKAIADRFAEAFAPRSAYNSLELYG